MKRIFTGAALCFSLILASCSDFLDRDPYEDYTDGDMLGSVEGLNTLLNGAYDIEKGRYYFGALLNL